MKKIVLIATLILAGYYVYNGNFSPSDNNVTVKELLDKVASTPVTSEEVKEALNNAIIGVCEVNGADTINGFGSTDECINNFENLARETCPEQLVNFEGKIYTSKLDLEVDMKQLFLCSVAIIRL